VFFDRLRAVQGCAAIFMAASHRKWEPFENRVFRMAILKKPWTAFSKED